MARKRQTRDMSMEEYEQWTKAQQEVDEQNRLTDEQGGPRLSVVPKNDQEPATPTDLLPAAGAASDPAIAAETAADFPNADPLVPPSVKAKSPDRDHKMPTKLTSVTTAFSRPILSDTL